jgi:hypothetical protein
MKIILSLCLSFVGPIAFGQGLVNFINQPGTLFTVYLMTNAAPPAFYRFALFTAPVGTTDRTLFTLAGGGVYATNQAAAGRIFGGNGVVVNGWAPGETLAFLVRGWESSAGTTWGEVSEFYQSNELWSGPGVFGSSAIHTGVAGGFDGIGTIPSLGIFGGLGIQTLNLGVPEPTSMALAGLGAASLLIFRRRK